MAASTVTGRGAGASYGEYKPELHCGGCGCGAKPQPDPPEPRKTYCHVNVRTCQISHHIVTNGARNIKVC